ncbi:T9SS type A sorting domain-containing protein [Flavobacterium sp. AS60]|uniref:T9SS type A sorting domain-containing protein n=1 Tax=Flavobacterium anseongense TaxID=2910677 RepID=UPI001F282422|nr:T9SS type A sorting domain-containing protein [Flavobacterium sp. AS60]MCF6129307.1 T9SS type A sorting domain-containing protein [Flavobacterium sp. AS60]
MNKFIYSVATFLMVIVASAQSSVVQAEYFWDTDPGYGLATPVLATDGSFNSTFEQLTKTGIVLPAVGLHVFNIRIKDNTGVWGPVFRNVISVQTTLGTADFDLKNVVVYPNPVKDILNISIDRNITAVALYNVLGQQVLTKFFNSNEVAFDISNLTAGTYFVKVASDTEVKTIKIIKQ